MPVSSNTSRPESAPGAIASIACSAAAMSTSGGAVCSTTGSGPGPSAQHQLKRSEIASVGTSRARGRRVIRPMYKERRAPGVLLDVAREEAAAELHDIPGARLRFARREVRGDDLSSGGESPLTFGHAGGEVGIRSGPHDYASRQVGGDLHIGRVITHREHGVVCAGLRRGEHRSTGEVRMLGNVRLTNGLVVAEEEHHRTAELVDGGPA